VAQARQHARVNNKRGVDLISDALPFGGLWHDGPEADSNAIGYAIHPQPLASCNDSRFRCGWQGDREHEHKGDFKEW
jgi:hypothetical protein